jgi:uncharacterized protein YdaU (DUF1376 family)
MSTKKPWFPLYAADFLTDIDGWTEVQVGIYIRLLLSQWINGPLPYDQDRLIRLCQTDADRWDEAWLSALQYKFELLENGSLIANPRLEQIREQQERFTDARRRAGRASGEARRKKGNGSSDIEQVFDSVANETRTKANQSKSKSKSNSTGGARAAPSTPAKKKARLPEDWHPDEKLLAWAQKTVPKVHIGSETEIFRDYFLGSGGTKLDWRRTWQTWMRKEAKKAHKVNRRMTFEQAERICIREGKTTRPGESRDEFIDRMQMLADGFG